MTGPDRILGHGPALELLQRMIGSGRLPHALLFQGPEGVGKASIARATAAALLCSRNGTTACGGCDECRLIDRGSHPDFLFVTLLPRKGASPGGELRSVIAVDQVREMSQLATLAPRRAGRRVFLVDPAERMNVEAQNALLKTLEEPPGRAVIFLVAARPHLLIPTVRSRCFSFRFAALRPRELASLLEARGFERKEALTRAALAEGRPGRALVLDVEAHRERRDRLIEVLERLTASPPALSELPTMAGTLAGKSRETLAESLDALEGLLRDAARAGLRPEDPALVHVDVAARLERVGRRLGPRRAAELLRAVERLRFQLRLNLNRTLVAEGLLASLAGGPLPA